MKARLSKIEKTLLPLPYGWMVRVYAAFNRGKVEEGLKMVQELDDVQYVAMYEFEKAREKWMKQHAGISDEETETNESTD